MKTLERKVALVTGAASGIGLATARKLARCGARVVLTDIDTPGERAASDLRTEGGQASFCQHDVSDEASWVAVISRALKENGQLDILVNNAGIAIAKPIAQMSLAEWRRVMAVNLDGVFLGTRQAIVEMQRLGRGGSIVNVSSAMGLVGAPLASAYCASKGAVRLFTKAVALEVAADGIRVNSVHPGGVRTPIWEKADWWREFVHQAGGPEGAWKKLAWSTPLGRFAEPEEIAEAIRFLASDDSKFITGSELVIDGGFTSG